MDCLAELIVLIKRLFTREAYSSPDLADSKDLFTWPELKYSRGRRAFVIHDVLFGDDLAYLKQYLNSVAWLLEADLPIV